MIVFLDMDGVLVDFVGGINKVFSLPKEFPPPKADGLPQWNWFENYGLTSREVNAVCDIDFWANLEWMHDGKQIFKYIEERVDQSNIYLLTTPMPNPGSGTGKMLWVNKHLPRYSERTIITQAPKSIFAGLDRLLIDDKDENVTEFVAAGGQGILVPRPWNELRGWAGETLQVVKNSLEVL